MKFMFTRAEALSAGVDTPLKLSIMVKKAMRNVKNLNISCNVGIVGQASMEGPIFFGMRVDFKDLPSDYSIHAEQFLLSNLALNSVDRLTHFAVSPGKFCMKPCFHCLELLLEIGGEALNMEFLITDNNKGKNGHFQKLETLLRPSFDRSSYLGNTHEFLQERHNGLTLHEHSTDELRAVALAAANKSFSRFKCPSGVALRDSDGFVYRGWLLQSYHAQVKPMDMALVDFIIKSGGINFKKIVETVLVECKNLPSQKDHVKKTLQTIASDQYDLHVVNCS